FGQSAEWSYDKSLDWHLCQFIDHEGVRLLVTDLNRFYTQHSFLPESDYDHQSFQWINSNDGDNSVISFVRYGTKPGELLLVVANLTPVQREKYRVGSPLEGEWIEALNTNAKRYGGDGAGNPEPLKTLPQKWDGRPFAVDVSLPGMAVLFFLFRPAKIPTAAPPPVR
ncbi:MAG: 1,4-alpha-glucan branching enzyme, partial [Verrucomicrobia bacterium]